MTAYEGFTRHTDNRYILVLSAKDSQRLLENAQKMLVFIEKSGFGTKDIRNICFTLQTGRELMESRAAFLVSSIEELKIKLEEYIEGYTNVEGMYLGEGDVDTQQVIKRKFPYESDYKARINSLIDEKNYEELCKVWAEGISIEWDRLYEGCVPAPRIMSLPSYSFENKEYWAPAKLSESKIARGTSLKQQENKILAGNSKSRVREKKEDGEPYETFLYEEIWIETAYRARQQACKNDKIVCFLSDKSARERLEESDLELELIFVEAGNAYGKADKNHYIVLPEDSESYLNCFNSISQDFGTIDGIFYFWTIENFGKEDKFFFDVITMIMKGFSKTGLKPGQLLLAGGYDSNLQRCYAESLIGFERSAGMILPETAVRVICKKFEENNMNSWISYFLTEYQADCNQSILYEDRIRKSLGYVYTDIEKNPAPKIHQEGVYLITGGLGGLGTIFAELLLEKYNAKLILTGRSDMESQKKKLKELEAYGKDILYVKADVCEYSQMKAVVEKGKLHFGHIDGVIHAAGIEGKGSVLTKSREEFNKVLGPKTKGTISLFKAIENESMDFVCLFSSTSAVLGDFGSCDYAIGNRFLIAAARYLFKNAAVVNWPLWKDGGMGVYDAEANKMYLKSSGQTYLETEAGTVLFEKIVNSGIQQVMAVIGKKSGISRFIKAEEKNIALKEKDKNMKLSDKNSDKKRGIRMSSWTMEDCILYELKDATEQILGIPKNQMQSDDNLADFGYDSISLAEFANVLTERLELEITPDIFFSHPTLDRLCSYFLSKHKDHMEYLYSIGEITYEVCADEVCTEEESDSKPVLMEVYDRINENIECNEDNEKSKFAKGTDRVAIIGLSGRFPEAQNVDGLWNILEQGKEVIKKVPLERKEWYENHGSNGYDYRMGVLSGIDEFDPLFFEISPIEAENMDPQQRLLLQEIWYALEDAGYGTRLFENEKIGVFVGAEDSDYKLIGSNDGSITSNNMSMLSARIAYFLDLKGPNMTLSTACSSGLMAVHQACLSISSGECDTAIAAGVSIEATASAYDGMEIAGMISRDRRCYAFDSRANGMVPAEAVGVVVLKRMSKAVKDRNRIYATVAGSGTNYDGKTNGITAPSGESQKELLKSVYDRYDINPENINYIIAHGTGTRLGDPIEMNALTDTFREYTNKKQFCAVGSVKANIGHALSASGVVSLISLVTAIHKEIIPRQINCEKESDYIKWDKSPFYINYSNREWKDEKGNKRMGAVSAFGMGGTNVHVVVESYPKTEPAQEKLPCSLLVLSAKTEEALDIKCQELEQMLEYGKDDSTLSDIGYTLLEGRKHFNYRVAIIANSRKEAAEMLRTINENSNQTNIFRNQVKRSFKAQAGICDIIKDLAVKCSLERNTVEYRKMLGAFAEFYTQGYEINGDLLFAGSNVRRVKLPIYPFLKEKCWKQPKNVKNIPKLAPDALKEHKAINKDLDDRSETLYIEETWESVQPTLDSCKAEGVILWFLSEEENINAVERYISSEGLNINPVYIYQGEQFELKSHGRYVIDSKNENDFERLFYHLKDTFDNINGIIYMWPTEEQCSLRNGEDIANILKGIHRTGLTPAKVLMAGLVGNGLERNLMESLIGFQRSIGMVLPDTTLKFVAGNTEYYTCKGFIKAVMEEYCLNSFESVFYENGTRKTLKLRKVEPEITGEAVIKQGGVYLITGGLGGIGFIVSKWLLNKYNARIVLTGRSMNAEKEEKLKKLKDCGNDVLYFQVDVCDKDRMMQVINETKRKFGTIDGVIHAAGIGGKSSILEKDLKEYKEVLAPKVQGTIVLDEIFKSDNLDFICYFSSTSAILGDFGSCEYSVGNRFMMSFAQGLARKKPEERSYKKVVVINWPLWKDGGMGLENENRTLMYMNASGQRLLQSSEAMGCLELLLCQRLPQLMVLVGKSDRLDNIISNKNSNTLSKESKQVVVKQRQSSVSNKNLSSGDIKKLLLKDLQCMAGELLKIPVEKMDYEAVISEFGFDSISLPEFANIINDHYNIRITPDIFYTYPTLLDLSGFLMSRYTEQVVKVYTECHDCSDIEIVSEADYEQISVSTLETVSETISEYDKDRVLEENLISQERIAIIGVSGRFPDAENVEELWKILEEGRNVIHEVDSDRQCFHMDNKARRFGSIPGIAEFDPLFFEIPPSEAEYMNPGQRLLMQEAWKALEKAGYGRKLLEEETIGVFVGCEENSYQSLVGKQGNITANNNAIMSARLAYLLNFGGPNMSINTACSSGLSAVHEACLSIKNGECDTAVVAGVNLIVEPSGYDKMLEAGMLSETQTCYAFDKRANGMVPAEAVAVIILKRMTKAVKDKNPILATIAGSGMNYDGRTNGITAPGGQAQTRLLKSVYKKHNINPENISYIIAHGTGTRLGDPIEMNALVDAFNEYTNKKQFCAVGSVKANIGHCLAASGVVSLISLVTAMHNEIIPAQINCEMESDYIKWDNSPFYLNRSNREWKDEKDRRRMGAVSSFGMSGTNVHVVIESYPKEEPVQEKYPYVLLALSARTEQALERKCADLIELLRNGNDGLTLSDIGYTLLEGRKHFTYRCAVVASDRKEAAEMLGGMNQEQSCVFKNKVKSNFIASDDEIGMVRNIEEKFAYEKDGVECKKILCLLSEKYCRGHEIDGDILFKGTGVKREILPTYPFTNQKYWINQKDAPAGLSFVNVIHPLLGKNISDFTKQKYSTVFTGQEFFFKDHIIGGKRTLPGVAYLEMAFTAVENAVGALRDGRGNVSISKIGWFRPITSGKESLEVHIGLEAGSDNTFTYEIYVPTGEENSVHSQGSIAFVEDTRPGKEDVEALMKQSTVSVSGEECYQLYSKLGMEYGEAFRCINQMFLCGGKVLAKLQMPYGTDKGRDEFVLHPGMMDAGLQATIGLAFENGMTDNINQSIPFALDEVTVYDRCAEEMWAVVRCNTSDEKLGKYDVNLCDASGNVCVQIKGYTSKETKQNDTGKAILLERKRNPGRLPASREVKAKVTTIFIGMKNPPENEIFIDVPAIDVQNLDIAYRDVATSVFEIIKGMMSGKIEEDRMLQVIIPNDISGRIYGSISGMLKTANQENPMLITKVIEADADETAERLLGIAKAEKNAIEDNYVIYIGNARYTENLGRIERCCESSIPWKDGGVYLITGGAGGLGRIFAKEIGYKTVGSTIIITGRYEESDRTAAAIREIEKTGVYAVYYKMDVADLQAIEAVLEKVTGAYGKIDGIIHSAGILKDSYIIKKTGEEFMEVLEPKVTGTIGLDIATKSMNLDFMIFFSSVTGKLGNPGQSDYAAANAFMDSYAHYRNKLVGMGLRRGRTMSVNWPLWKDGGMQIDTETEEMLKSRVGFLPMPVQAGIQALYDGWSKGLEEILCLYGENRLIDKVADDLCKEKIIIDEPEEVSMEDYTASVSIKDEAISFLKNLISKNLKIPLEFVDEDYLLDEYGLDSIAIISLIKKMEDTFGVLPKTLLYEYATIEELAEYFVKKHSKKLSKMVAKYSKKEENKKDLPKEQKTFNENVERAYRFSSTKNARFIKDESNADEGKAKEAVVELKEAEESGNADIAIIGLSGRYPMARDLKKFWSNMKEGKDCISEIPGDRWNYELYYDPDKNKKGKCYMKDGGFIDGVYEFDPLFFSMSPRDSKYTDPQERLFLECVYEAIEDAGYTKKGLGKLNSSGMGGNVGVYLGVMWVDYQLFGAQEQVMGNPIVTTGSQSSIANRVSYFFDFHGPSMAVDTMCSSSITAIHLACQSLRLGECDAAIAGGVNLSVHPNKYLLLAENKFASSRGRCESFGDKGEGYVPGEGVGAVLLKPLARAIEDGDHIYGVIKGTSLNHGGNTSGYLVPNPNAQASVIEAAFKKAGIDPRTISYIEAHGTGTSLGDPIEIAGLTKAYEKYTEDKQFCMIGSVKSNIGHLEGAAGIAGLTKVLLQMKYEQIVPSIHSNVLNPYIDFENTPFCVSRSNSKWNRPEIEEKGVLKEYPRRAGISSFGAGGANAHIIVEEYIPKGNYTPEFKDKAYAIILSAKSRAQLEEQAQRLYEEVKENYISDFHMTSIAYTLQTGREIFDYRLGILASSTSDLINQLEAFMRGNTNIEDGIWFGHVKQGTAKHNKATGGDTGSNVDLLLDQRNMAELLSIWIKGNDFDWNRLYSESKPQKISLPTYPFLKDVYFGADKTAAFLFGSENGVIDTQYSMAEPKAIVSVKATQEEQVIVKTEANKAVSGLEYDGTELMVFREEWNEKEEKQVVLNEMVVVCLAQNSELRQAVNNEVQILGARITLVWVSCGARYQKNSSQEYQISYEQMQDYELCLKEIKKDFKNIHKIIYLNPLSDKVFLSESRGIIYILQGIHRAEITGAGMIIAGSYENGLERAYVESWIGMERSIKLVLSESYVKVVLGDKNAFSYGDFINMLLKEMYSEEKCSVLYEDGKRKVLEIKHAELKSTIKTAIKEGGTYLITGGSGGLGMMFAKWLGNKYHARIILTGRRSADSIQDKLRQLLNDGIDITYVQADVCNVNQMKYAIGTAKKKYGHLDGIIHSAGIEGSQSIVDKDIDEYQRVINPKIQGTIAIDKVLIGETLDFICYFSSSSAILGDFGSCDYSVGNRFLMSYAKYRNSNANMPGKAVVINWPLWKNGGMGFSNAASSKMYLKTSGQRFLYEEEGTELFDRLLGQDEEEFLVMVGQRNKVYNILKVNGTDMGKKSYEGESLNITGRTTANKQGKGWKSIMKGWTVGQSIMWDLKELLYELMSVPKGQMDEDMNLADFGFDSVSLSDYANMISDKFEISFTPNLFYNYSTLNELTKYISNTFSKEIQLFYSEGSDHSPVIMQENISQKISKEEKIIEEPVSPDGQQAHYGETIAIVGISGKFPDSENPEELWNIIKEGREVIHEIQKERSEWYEDDSQNHPNQKIGSIRGIDRFDAGFFEISPREAESMDPRQRLLLEETWKALEDAGFGYDSFADEKVGVFVGAEDGDYHILQGENRGITSNHNAIMSARISYFLNLSGPNMSINTACSSGLVAVHQACQSLGSGESDVTIAAGVNLLITPIGYRVMDNAGMLSEDKRCYAFDKRANGMVPSEAVAVIVLKRLSDAEKDNNTIYGVIEGSGINYDGKTNGITAPSGRAQAMLLKEVYKKNTINPAEIDYIVTHGTSTRLGDPIEINALVDAFAQSNAKKESIALTSNKPNIGHSLAASGIVSLISLIMAMKHEIIPASINCSQRSEYINWEESPFYINMENRVWKDSGDKRRLGAVNAFGMSGTNVHVVVGSYQPKQGRIKKQYPYYLLAFSAKTPEALNKKSNDLIHYLENGSDDIDMADISYTLLDGRQHFEYRMAVVAVDKTSAIDTLKQVLAGGKVPNSYQGMVRKNFSPQISIQRMVTSLCCESMRSIDGQEAVRDNLNALAEFYCMGYQVKAGEMFKTDNVSRVRVPLYPFDSKRYWVHKNGDSRVFEPTKQKEPELIHPNQPSKDNAEAQIQLARDDSPKATGIASAQVTVEQHRVSFAELVKELAKSLAAALYMDTKDIDYDKSFTEMGLDSIVGVEWIRHVNKMFGTNIPSTKIYQYPTITEFARYVNKLAYNTDEETEKGEVIKKTVKESLEDKNLKKEIHVKDEEQAGHCLVPLDRLEAFEDWKTDAKPTGKTQVKLENLDYIEPNHGSLVNDDSQKAGGINSRHVPAGQHQVSFAELAEELAKSLAAALYMDVGDIDYDKSFMEMGLDSIIGVEWIRHVNKIYGTNISSTMIYQHPTITEFSRYLKETLSVTGNGMGEEIPNEYDINQLLLQVYQGEVDAESAQKLIYKE